MGLHKSVVLIVEEEPLLRLAALDMVAEAGLEPVEARDAEQALRVLESRRDIRIVFTDLDLSGGMDGLALVEAICSRWPPVKLILTSSLRAPAAEQLPPGSRFFPKPYSDTAVTDAMLAMAA